MLIVDKFRKNVLSLITIIVIIIAYACQIFIGGFDVFQTIVLLAIIPLCITVIFEHKSSFENIESSLEKIMNTLPEDSIKLFKSFKEGVDEIERMYKKTKDSIYIASLDYVNRGDGRSKSRDKLNNLKKRFAAEEKIKHRYLAYPTVKKLEGVRENIVEGNMRDKKSCYAFIFVNEKVYLPFATFIVFDKKHVFIRAPYEVGKDASYMLISNHLIAEMFYNWHDMIWKKAEEIDNIDILERYIETAKIRESKGVVC